MEQDTKAKVTDKETLELLKIYDEQYNEAVKEASMLRNKQRDAALNDWARDNARFNIGDMLECQGRFIQVIKIIGRAYGRGKLYVEYYGPELTKKLQPRKDGFETGIYDDGRLIRRIKGGAKQ